MSHTARNAKLLDLNGPVERPNPSEYMQMSCTCYENMHDLFLLHNSMYSLHVPAVLVM